MDVKLIAVEGEWRDQTFPMDGPELVIGRAATCQLQIDHSLVDLEHCRIRNEGDRVVLEDLGSTFGTSLNGKRITNVDLRDGDRIRVGPSTFVVNLSGASPVPLRAPQPGREEPARPQGRGRAPDEDTPVVQSARQIYDRLMSHRADAAAATAAEAVPIGSTKQRLQVARERQGVSLVQVLPRAIINDAEIQQIGQELEDLIDQGRRRIVLDFSNVKHLSSQAVGVLIQAQKRCRMGGGLLKLCNPNPAVAEVFKITNLPRAIEIHPDEIQAFQTGWPEPPRGSAAPAPASPAGPAAASKPKSSPSLKSGTGPRAPGPVRLVLENGKQKGKAIKIQGSTFLIGRDPQCQLRPASSAVSRLHTRIEIRDGRVYVRDLGTTNGTLLAHRLLRNAEAEAYNNDLIQIGPLLFRIAFQQPYDPEPPSGLPADASWLLQGNVEDLSDTALFTVPTGETLAEARQRALSEVQHLRYRVSGDVLIVTVLSHELREEEQIAPVRHELQTLMERPVPKQVVLNLDHVTYLSSSAIGMLLAHHQRLARAGGGMRFAQIRHEVRPALENQRVTMLVESFPSIEQAVTEPWPIAEGS